MKTRQIANSNFIEPIFKLETALWRLVWITPFEKFWQNPEIDTWTTPEDVWHWGWLYTWLPTFWVAETLEISSASPLDTDWWTWARTVVISWLLDEDYNQMPSITVTLNWTTPVSLWVQTYWRANRIQTLTAWSTWTNQWILTLKHTTTTTNVFARMPALRNQTTIMAFTVPLWKIIAIDKWNIQMGRASGAAWSAEVTVRARPFGW